MGLLDALKGVAGHAESKQREIVGEIERVGVLPGTDNASYVFCLKMHTRRYFLAGGMLSQDEIWKSGAAIALTAPGDQVRFLYDERKDRVTSFANISYTK